jgi:TRAP transporter TAXI family solute receptor
MDGSDGSDGDDTDGSDGDEEITVRVGTSAGGTMDVGLAIERAMSQESDLVSYSTIEAPGYVGTTYQLANDVHDAGIVDTNTLNKAQDGRDMFEEDPVDQLPWQGFYAWPYAIYMMARDGTDIETFDDLAGADVYPAEPGYSTRATTLEVLQQDPVADVYDEMNILDMDVSDAPGAMEEGRIDAAIAYGTPGAGNTGWVTEYDARVDVHYVQHTDALVEAIQGFSGAGYSEWENASEQFQWEQDIGTDTIVTWNLEVMFVFHPETADEAAYEICRVADEHTDVVQEAENRFFPESPDDMVGAAIADYPFHPGAAQYYQDNDVWNDDWVVGDREMIGEYFA